jgi:hypothetical protein
VPAVAARGRQLDVAGGPSLITVELPIRVRAVRVRTPLANVSGDEANHHAWGEQRQVLTADQYAMLFDALAAELSTSPFDRTERSKRVRDRTDLAGKSVGRSSVNFVLQGLVYLR